MNSSINVEELSNSNNIEIAPFQKQNDEVFSAIHEINKIKTGISANILSEIDIVKENTEENIVIALKNLNKQLEEISKNTSEQIEIISETHDLYYFLSKTEILQNIDLNTLLNQTKLLRENDKNFNSIKNILIETTNGGKKEIADTISEMIKNKKINIEILTAKQLAFIFSKLKDGSCFEEMIDIYEASSSQHFIQSTKIQEFLAVAYHKVGEKEIKEGNIERAKILLEKSEVVLNNLIEQGKGNGEVFAIKAKIYKLKNKIFANTESVDKKNILLQKSIEMSEQGYLLGFEFYPGINLVYNKITLSSETDDSEELKKSLKIAELVYMSAQKAGGIQSNDFWTVTTMLEASILQGKQNERLLNRVLDLAQVDWEIDAPIENLSRLKVQLNQFSSLANKNKLIKNIDWAIEKLEKCKKQLQSGNKQNNENKEEISPENKILRNGFSYGEIASFSGGNIDYGGQLHDHVVNRWDIDVAKKILDYLELSENDDFNHFNEVIDNIIRNKYGTKSLEDLSSPEHKEFDIFMKNFNKIMSVQKQTDSRTNIMVDFYLGKGDCRQHAYTKQLFFDVWKINRVNHYLESAYKALNKNNQKEYIEATNKAKEMINLQMMVFDSTIKSAIKITDKYSPVRNTSGELIKSDNIEEVEDHTWNGLVKFNDDESIDEFFMTDSFYQNEYQFGGINSIDKKGQSINGIPVEDFSDFSNKEKGFRCGYIEVINNFGKKEKIEVRMIPAIYAGNRDSRMKSFSDDLGIPQIRGLIIDDKINIDNFFSHNVQANIEKMVKKIVIETGQPRQSERF